MQFLTTPISTAASILLTDSRLVKKATQSIFFAIRGLRHDGHQYIDELIKKGVREFVVETGSVFTILGQKIVINNSLSDNYQVSNSSELSDIIFWITNDSTLELQKLTARHRDKFNIPVVGITGSNGKTIVKEWLAELLSEYEHTLKSPRSYNSQIGVPLSVWQLNSTHKVAIFEAGISQKNEMKKLAEVIKPTVGIFTNIGSAHSEGFNNRKEKIVEKLKLFASAKFLIYCVDHQEIDEEVRVLLLNANPGITLIGWSVKPAAHFFVKVAKSTIFSTLTTIWEGKTVQVEIPFIDDASIENCIHVLVTLLVIRGIENMPDFRKLRPLKMRLEMKMGTNDSYLIDDSYNNDLGGLEMALNFMNQHHTKRKKLLIISDIYQSGLSDHDLYAEVGRLMKSKGIDEVIGVGDKISEHKPMPGYYFKSTDDFLQNLPVEQLTGRFILLKGARDFAFERIVRRLEQKIHGTVFEINLDAVQQNLNFFRSKLSSGTKLMAMVKAYAYGSGSTEIAAFLQYHRVDYLAVAYTDEGVELRKNGIELPIMVLNPQPESYQNLLDYQLEPEIYSLKKLKKFLYFVESESNLREVKIHLKIDTGMHRLGFSREDTDELVSLLKNQVSLKVASVFSHLAASDERELKDFTAKQIDEFLKITELLSGELAYSFDRHICNTAGIIHHPEAHFEMVRLGIGLYGIDTLGSKESSLRPIGRLKTVISQIKTVRAGETVGYGRRGKVSEDGRIATIAIGYADGFDRGFGNGGGKVNVNGTLCPVIGNVCMDMTMIDVTNVPCEEGDEVVIFGEDPSITDLAKQIGTIPYEILTNVGERVKRVFFKE